METRIAPEARKNTLRGGVALLVATTCLAALADNAYLAVVDPNQSSSYNNSANWRKGSASGDPLGPSGGAIDPAYDYIVPNAKTLRTPTTSATFGGKSLTVNSGGTLALCAGSPGREYTFSGDGLILTGNIVSWWANNPVVKGNVTIPADARVEMYDNVSSSSIGFDCSLSGESSSTVWAYGYNNAKCRVRFKDSTLSGYSGKIVGCTRNYASRNLEAVPAQATTISIGTVETSASVTIHPYCTITAESAGDLVSLASLEMMTNTTIAVVYDKSSKTASCIKVTGTFTHGADPVKIAFEPNPTIGSWPDSEIVPELQILKAPSGVTLNTNDFVLVTSAQFPVYDLYVRPTEDGLSTLCIKQCGRVIKQTTKDSYGEKTTSSFVAGGHWSDGNLPNPTNWYYSGVEQRAYTNVFLGRALARQSGNLELQEAETRIDDLRVIGTSTYGMNLYNFHGSAKLTGHLHLVSENNFTCLCGHTGSGLTVASEIDGPGQIFIKKTGDPSIVTVKITNTNDFYTGQITSSCDGASDSKHSILEFADGRSLGGAMPSWKYNGHTFNAYTYFTPLASTTLERENCGIFVSGFARVVCNDGITLTVKERTTWNGEIKKLDVGTLDWGGEQPYFTTDGGNTPVAGNNSLVIAEGVLRPASAAAFRGVAVTIADGAGIGVDIKTDTTTDLAKYGMDLRPAGSSLTIEAASVTPVVSVPDGIRGTLAAAICTVPAESAAAVRGKLNTSSYLISNNICIQGFERVNEDTSVTFGVKAKKLGTVIMFY